MANSAAFAVKTALVTLLTETFAADPKVCVTFGHPGVVLLQDDYVSVMGVVSDQEWGPMGRPHSREETLRVTVIVSSYMGGGAEVQPLVTERAFALLTALEDALRDDVTINGTCRLAQIEGFEASDADDPDILAQGRVTEIVASVLVKTRI